MSAPNQLKVFKIDFTPYTFSNVIAHASEFFGYPSSGNEEYIIFTFPNQNLRDSFASHYDANLLNPEIK